MRAELADGVSLDRATPNDRAALESVCLATGDSGRDASDSEDDPTLLGQIFAVPYLVFAPEFAFMARRRGMVRGYAFGVPDTAAFEAWLHGVWFPDLRERLVDPGPDPSRWKGSDWARRHIHHPPKLALPALNDFPAHGHIDLMPDVRGHGVGRRMLSIVMTELRRAGASGMHLDVSPENTAAQKFYAKQGFRPLGTPIPGDDRLFFVKSLQGA